MATRRTCISPLHAALLVAGAFAVGLLAERGGKLTHKAEAKARAQARRGKAAVIAAVRPRAKVGKEKTTKPAAKLPARSKPTAGWQITPTDFIADDGKEFTQTINGVEYLLWAPTGRKTVYVNALSPDTNKADRIGEYNSISEAKRKAEAHAKGRA